jgi:predicted RNA binding protein YcfA (HicA-like mRNA interferase family)
VTWSSREVVKVLEAHGFVLVRRGKHDTFKRSGHRYLVSVPRDERNLPIGTVRAIWRQAGIDPKDAEASR